MPFFISHLGSDRLPLSILFIDSANLPLSSALRSLAVSLMRHFSCLLRHFICTNSLPRELMHPLYKFVLAFFSSSSFPIRLVVMFVLFYVFSCLYFLSCHFSLTLFSTSSLSRGLTVPLEFWLIPVAAQWRLLNSTAFAVDDDDSSKTYARAPHDTRLRGKRIRNRLYPGRQLYHPPSMYLPSHQREYRDKLRTLQPSVRIEAQMHPPGRRRCWYFARDDEPRGCFC